MYVVNKWNKMSLNSRIFHVTPLYKYIDFFFLLKRTRKIEEEEVELMEILSKQSSKSNNYVEIR